MCLAVPAQIITCEGEEALVSLHGSHMRVSLILTPQAKVGDWALIHAGFVIQLLDEQEARETFALLREMELTSTSERPADAKSRG